MHRMRARARDAHRMTPIHAINGAKGAPIPGRALRYFTYLVFAAFASAATALFESCCEFMNFVTTSEIAPAAASG